MRWLGMGRCPFFLFEGPIQGSERGKGGEADNNLGMQIRLAAETSVKGTNFLMAPPAEMAE